MVLFALAGCARTVPGDGSSMPGGPGTPGTQASGAAGAALAAWSGYPASRKPRPVVNLPGADPFVIVSHPSQTENVKLALQLRSFELAAGLPRGPVNAPDGRPLRSAQDAWAQLSKVPDPAPAAKVTPLKVTSVRLGTAAFRHDRLGDLPAWIFETAEITVAWPALAEPEYWSPPGAGPVKASPYAKVKSSGTTLTVEVEALQRPCPGDPEYAYEAEVKESEAVAVVSIKKIVKGTAPGEKSSSCAYSMVYRSAPYQVTLAKPLGDRVLVSGEGAPALVTSES
ncbi:hypothetical protein [Longispora albida]|uniref:hypothetical protein n=1 Tax=Longispora albida TaxID=203523 RepID=UPI0003782370|nr:hypothetical protein [Longispora albida]